MNAATMSAYFDDDFLCAIEATAAGLIIMRSLFTYAGT